MFNSQSGIWKHLTKDLARIIRSSFLDTVDSGHLVESNILSGMESFLFLLY